MLHLVYVRITVMLVLMTNHNMLSNRHKMNEKYCIIMSSATTLT